MDAVGQPSIQTRKRIRKRAFRPFFLWLPIAALLLVTDAHFRLLKNTRIFFSVSLEGHAIPTDYTASLNTLAVRPGQQAGLAWRTFSLAMNDAEPVEKACFIWYGSNFLGDFNLTAHKGALEVVADPPPNDLQITGRWFSATTQKSPADFPAVPVGDYTVTARYDWSREEKLIRVQHDQTNRLTIQPDVGSFDFSVQPADAQFRLTSLKRQGFILTNRAPAQLRHLPSGEYQLRVWRGDYFKEPQVTIKRGETNRLTVTFDYGQVQLVSDPAGATVYEGTQAIGQTPKVFNELKPGQHRFRLEQAGYEPAQVSFEIRGDESLTIRTNLVNIRFQAAMLKARRLASGVPPDYPGALASVTEALEAQPGDPDAAALKAKLEGDLQHAGLEQRKKFASDKFKEATDKLKDTALFDTHQWTVSGKVSAVRAALLRMLDKPLQRWTVQQQSPDDEPVIFHYKGEVNFGRRSCVILASQVSPDEVHVYAKFWDYVLSNRITLSLLLKASDDSFVPVHPNYYLRDQPGAAEARRRQMAETFWKNLQTELRSDHGQ